MDILSAVEKQLERLRNAQKLQDEQATALAMRQEALRQLEQGLDTSIQELRENRRTLEADRQALDADRRNFDSHWQKFTDQMNQEQQTLATLRTQMQQEQVSVAAGRDELRTLKAEQDLTHQSRQEQFEAAQHALAKRGDALDALEKDIARREQDVQVARDRAALLQTQVQVQTEQLDLRKRELDQERAEVSAKTERIEAAHAEARSKADRLHAELEKRTEQHRLMTEEMSALKKRLKEANQERQEAEDRAEASHESRSQEAGDLRKQMEKLAADLSAARGQRDAAQAAADQAQKQLAELSTRVDALQQHLKDREVALADQQAKLETANEAMTRLTGLLQEQAPQLEKGAAAAALAAGQAEQIERLTRQVAELSVAVNPQELASKEQRIAELTEALREARGMATNTADGGVLQAANAELQSQVDQLRVELEQAKLAADEARSQLKSQAAIAGASSSDARIAQYESQLQELLAKLDAARSESQTRLASAADDLSRHTQKAREDRQAHEQATRQFQQRISDLESELERARTASATAGESPADQGAAEQKLKVKARRIAAVAEHLKRRQRRLRRLRSLLEKQRQTNSTTAAPPKTEAIPAHDPRKAARAQLDLEEQRRHLMEARRSMAETEQQMMARWARPQAGLALGVLGLLAAVIALVSWFAADHFFPARVSASVTMEAKARAGGRVSSDEAQAWADWHTNMAGESEFRKVIASRMEERRLENLADPAALGRRLDEDFTIDNRQPGVVTLTLAGRDRDKVCAELDIIATTLATESNRRQAAAQSTPSTNVLGERREGARLQYAVLNPGALQDSRLAAAAIIFLAACVALSLLYLLAYAQLKRAKRLFEEQGNDDGPQHVMGAT